MQASWFELPGKFCFTGRAPARPRSTHRCAPALFFLIFLSYEWTRWSFSVSKWSSTDLHIKSKCVGGFRCRKAILLLLLALLLLLLGPSPIINELGKQTPSWRLCSLYITSDMACFFVAHTSRFKTKKFEGLPVFYTKMGTHSDVRALTDRCLWTDVKACFHRLRSPDWLCRHFALPEVRSTDTGLVGSVVGGSIVTDACKL